MGREDNVMMEDKEGHRRGYSVRNGGEEVVSTSHKARRQAPTLHGFKSQLHANDLMAIPICWHQS